AKSHHFPWTVPPFSPLFPPLSLSSFPSFFPPLLPLLFSPFSSSSLLFFLFFPSSFFLPSPLPFSLLFPLFPFFPLLSLLLFPLLS
ncbi:hypothetical protein ACXWR7_11360, partial [Streptococcus pyogenes]